MKTHHIIPIPPNVPEYQSHFTSFYCVLRAVWNAKLQIARIKKAKHNHDVKKLFADIHFFLVAVSNIQKMMLRLRKLSNKDRALASIVKKHRKPLEQLDHFRDNLEHFDERLDGVDKKKKPLTNPGMLGNLFGDEYDFGGKRFNLKDAFSLVENLQADLLDWNEKNLRFPVVG